MKEKKTDDIPNYSVEDPPLLTTSAITTSNAHDEQRLLVMENTTDFNPAPMLIGGIPAIKDYMVWLPQAGCSGFLVRPCILLTAAHCNVTAGDVALIGSTDALNPSAGSETIEILTSICHPLFPGAPGAILDYDYRVVLLKQKSKVTTFPNLAGNNPQHEFTVNQTINLLGYGLTGNPLQQQLVTNYDNCVGIPITPRQFCTNGNPVIGACMGDSGGPALELKERAVGITSWGYIIPNTTICNTSKPTIHAYIPDQINWINGEIRRLETLAKAQGIACGGKKSNARRLVLVLVLVLPIVQSLSLFVIILFSCSSPLFHRPTFQDI